MAERSGGDLERSSAFYQGEGGRLNKDIISASTLSMLRRYDLGRRVLLMGIGDGLVLEALASDPRHQVTVVEGSATLVARYSEHRDIACVHSLFEDYRPEDPFDSVIGTHVLEHVADPIAVAVMAAGWARQEGRLFFTVPNADSLHRRIGVEMGLLPARDALHEQDISQGHRRVYRAEILKRDLVHAGLVVQEIRGYILKTMSNQQMAHLSADYLRASLQVSLELPPEYCSSLLAVCRRRAAA